jgi:hypothetical protein
VLILGFALSAVVQAVVRTGHVCLVGGFGLYTRTLGEETMTIRELYSHVGQEDIVIEALKDFPDNVAAFAMPWASDEGRLRNGADTGHRRQAEAAQKAAVLHRDRA